jgi:hypothetical protein
MDRCGLGLFLFAGRGKMADTPEREEIARLYGFDSYAELLHVSESLPVLPGDTARSYMAQHPSGRRFLWDDPTQPVKSNDDA